MMDENRSESGVADLHVRVGHALDCVGASESGRKLVELVRRAESSDGLVGFEEWEEAVGDVATSSFSVDQLARFVLLLSGLVPSELLRDVLQEREGVWRRCAEILVMDPKLDACRILRHDLSCSYWYWEVLSSFDRGGARSVIELIEGEAFFQSEMGVSIAQNVLLALVRERLRERWSELRQLQASFSKMKALSRKLSELLAAEPDGAS